MEKVNKFSSHVDCNFYAHDIYTWFRLTNRQITYFMTLRNYIQSFVWNVVTHLWCNLNHVLGKQSLME